MSEKKVIYELINTLSKTLMSLQEEVEIDALNPADVALIREQYDIIKKKNAQQELYLITSQVAEDVMVFIGLYSFLWRCVSERSLVKDMVYYLECHNIENKEYWLFNILMNYSSDLFIRSQKSTSQERQFIRQILQSSVQEIIQKNEIMDLSYIPVENRNENRVIILTNQFLGQGHAPTFILTQIYYALKNIGKEPYLLVWNENQFDSSVYGNLNSAYLPDKILAVLWNNMNIKGMQFFMSPAHPEQFMCMLSKIVKINPKFVWYIGGISTSYPIVSKMTTVAAMGCTSDYLLGDSQIYLNYFRGTDDNRMEQEEEIKQRGGTPISVMIPKKIYPVNENITKKDLGLPEGKLIALIGNRLSQELTNEVILYLRYILQSTKDTYIVLIGDMQDSEKKFHDEVFHDRVINLGYQEGEKYATTVTMCDMIFNPPRKGGGSTANVALRHKIPLVTLGECDVSTIMPAECICKDVQELQEKTIRLLTDEAYYRLVKEILQGIDARDDSWEQCVSKIVKQVEEAL